MKKLIILLSFISIPCFSQETFVFDQQRAVNILHKTLNEYRADLNKMDSVCLDDVKNGYLPYTREKTVDSIFPFILNQKLCKEALKRCNYNIKTNKEVFLSKHHYESFECDESIHMESSSISYFNIEKVMESAILGLIIDGEPIVGHREMLLDDDPKKKYIGFGCIIIKNKNRLDILVIVLTSTLKGLQNPINFNNTYRDRSKVVHLTRKDLINAQKNNP